VGKPESAVVLVELLMWLKQVEIWRLQRQETELLKVEPDHLWTEDEELSLISYPKGENTCEAS
jgi:hypothetical protein